MINSRRVLDKDPTFPFVGNFAAWAQLHKGDRPEALKWFEELSSGPDGIKDTEDDQPGVKGWIHAINGQREAAEEIAELPRFTRLPLRRVEIYGLLRDTEKTLDALEDQAALNPLRAAFYLTYPELRFLQGNPRFEALRERLTRR